jgi:hypothetical protein
LGTRAGSVPPRLPFTSITAGTRDSWCSRASSTTLGGTVQRLTAGEFVIVRAGTIHTFATVGDTPASILVTMTPEIDALIRELHQVPTAQRDVVWDRFNSALV